MRGFLYILFFIFSFYTLHAQNTNKNKPKVKKAKAKKVEGFTFLIGNPSDSLFVTFSKGTDESELTTDGPSMVWLGKHYADNHFSEVVITFSRPVTSISLELSHFNNDPVGNEKLKDFRIYDEEQSDLTPSTSFQWSDGPASGVVNSILNGTIFNKEDKTIMAAKDHYGESASGRLTISNSQSFTQITFAHRVIFGVPNGILINTNINYTLGERKSKVAINQTIDTIQVLSKITVDSSLKAEDKTITPQTNNLNKKVPIVATSETTTNNTNLVKNVSTESLNDPQLSKKKLLKRIKSLEPVNGFTFPLCEENDPLNITYYKGSENTNLSLQSNNKLVWLGEFNPMEDFSTVILEFSKPINSVTINMTHFNNNQYGSEQIQNFTLLDEQLSEISSSAQYKWSSVVAGTTTFNEKNQTIIAAEGKSGVDASGNLSINTTTPFRYIAFTHKSNRGTPNGIYIQSSYACPQPVITENNLSKATTNSTKEATPEIIPQEIKDSVISISELPLAIIDSIPLIDTIKPKIEEKEKVVKKATVVPPKKTEVKPAPKKIPAPVTKPPVKKTPAPVAKTVPVKPAPKPPVKNNNVVKAAPKKTEPAKPIVKKAPSTPKTVVKKPTPVVSKPKPVVKKPQPYTLAQIAKLKTGDKIKLERVFFKQSLPELLPESYPQLDTLIIILNQYPTLKIELQGYTDNVGNPQKNLILSEQRVLTVKKYLISEGIAPERLSQRGFGGTDLVTEDTSEESRKLNRRVEFLITDK